MSERASESRWPADAPAVAHVIHDGSLDDDLVVSAEDGHHLQRVRRVRVGEVVTAADGVGKWREYSVDSSSRGTLSLRAKSSVRIEPRLQPQLAIAFSLTKGGKPDAVAARLTELGVDRLMPVIAARSVVRWKSTDRKPDERLHRVVREAAMQCRRARLPTIEPVRSLADLADTPDLVVAERDGIAASELPVPGATGWVVLVGPEGGFEPGELEVLGSVPRLGLGAYVLRAETAAVAAAGALNFHRLQRKDHGGWARRPDS